MKNIFQKIQDHNLQAGRVLKNGLSRETGRKDQNLSMTLFFKNILFPLILSKINIM